VKIVGARVDATEIYAIGTIREDFLYVILYYYKLSYSHCILLIRGVHDHRESAVTGTAMLLGNHGAAKTEQQSAYGMTI
jgi:hypothetical protein